VGFEQSTLDANGANAARVKEELVPDDVDLGDVDDDVVDDVDEEEVELGDVEEEEEVDGDNEVGG
jgi:hypothetical protein